MFKNLDLLKLAKRIRKKGVKTAIVTNNGFWSRKRERTVILDVQWASLFDEVIESCRIGIRKPEKEIFKVILIFLKNSAQAEGGIFL